MKLDMSKAYDRLEAVMGRIGLHAAWINRVLHYVTFVSFEVLVNGNRLENLGWGGIFGNRTHCPHTYCYGGTCCSHLLLADDSIFFPRNLRKRRVLSLIF